MSKTCLKCGNVGHNSRSCSSTKDYYWSTHTLQQQHLDDNKLIAKERSSLRLFGVQLLEDHHHHDLSSSNSNSNSSSISVARKRKGPIDSMASHPRYLQLPSCLSGYQPTIDINRSTNQLKETKYIKRVEWSEEEHRRFLEGIEKLGKGDWRGISRHYVTTRSPIQIASHAQNYFLRLEADANQVRRRRPSRPFHMQMQGEPSGHMSRYKPNSTDDEEASIDHINPYDRCPEVHHSTPPRDLGFNNVKSSFQSASAAAEGLDLDLKLAASYY